LEFDADAFEDLAWWIENDRKKALKIIRSVGKQKQGIEATSHLFLYFNP
jgi:toxin YoeB